MAKYTLTVATDDINDVVQCLTPALVAAVKGGHVLTEQPSEGKATEEVYAGVGRKVEEAPKVGRIDVTEEGVEKPAAKRGRKPKAVEPECAPEPVVEQPVAEEKAEDDFADALGEETTTEDVVVTKQQVTDVAVEVGGRHGRATMVAAITKFAPTGKLAGVAEGDYPKLFKVLTKLASITDKAAAKAFLETV